METRSRARNRRAIAEQAQPASFNNIPDDCILNILPYLPVDDINSFGTITSRYHLLRRHRSLCRKRTATIVCTPKKSGTTLDFFCDAFDTASRVLSDDYSHLKIVGLEVLPAMYPYNFPSSRLRQVTKLELVSHPNDRHHKNQLILARIEHLLPTFLPNVQELVVNGVKFPSSEMARTVYDGFQRLTKVEQVEGSTIDIKGGNYAGARRVTEVSLNNCCFFHHTSGHNVVENKRLAMDRFSNPQGQFDANYILSHFALLQRISMKGATWKACIHSEPEVIPQKVLIKMVRNHVHLRWLNSGLSEENVAMLKRERPEITFVNE